MLRVTNPLSNVVSLGLHGRVLSRASFATRIAPLPSARRTAPITKKQIPRSETGAELDSAKSISKESTKESLKSPEVDLFVRKSGKQYVPATDPLSSAVGGKMTATSYGKAELKQGASKIKAPWETNGRESLPVESVPSTLGTPVPSWKLDGAKGKQISSRSSNKVSKNPFVKRSERQEGTRQGMVTKVPRLERKIESPSKSIVGGTAKKSLASKTAIKKPAVLANAVEIKKGPRRLSGKDIAALPLRLVKRVAASRKLTRRQAGEAIKERRVTVNGKCITDPSLFVKGDDKITLDGKELRNSDGSLRIWVAHKLTGELVTRADPQGRPTIFQRFQTMGLPDNLIAVGRLDYNTDGLLLFTTNGDLSRFLEHPDNEIPRTYRAKVRGRINDAWLKSLRRGIKVAGVKYKPIIAEVERTAGDKTCFVKLKLSEGKNREVRKVLEHMNLFVSNLTRIEFGPYTMSGLPRGAVKEVHLDNSLRRSFLKDMASRAEGAESKPTIKLEDAILKDQFTIDVKTDLPNVPSTSKPPTLAVTTELALPPKLMNVAMLRNELILRGINITGGKPELVKALEQAAGLSSNDSVDEMVIVAPPKDLKDVSDLNHLRIIDLKSALKEHGVKHAGDKASLRRKLFEVLSSAPATTAESSARKKRNVV